MSSGTKCGDCHCFDKTQCVKKGNAAEVIETEKSYMETSMVMDAPATEHNDKCQCKSCGSSCTYPNCACGQ